MITYGILMKQVTGVKMNSIKEKIINFLSEPKRIRRIDMSILLIASISLILMVIGAYYIKVLNQTPPIDINWVAVIMMLCLIFLYGLKLFVSKKTRVAFQLILLVIVLASMSVIVKIAKHILLPH